MVRSRAKISGDPFTRTAEAEVDHRQRDVRHCDLAVLVDVAGGTLVERAFATPDADHLGDLGAEDDAVGVAVAAAFAEAVEAGLANAAALRLTSRTAAAARRRWPGTRVPGGQSSSVTQVGSGVGVTVGVDRSRQTPSTQERPGGQSSSSSQAMVGVGVGAGTQTSSGPHTCPTGQSLVASVQGIARRRRRSRSAAVVLVGVAVGCTVTLARMNASR